jgi:hypothetical protein
VQEDVDWPEKVSDKERASGKHVEKGIEHMTKT